MDYVTLANGEKVAWEEFSKWSYPKQVRNINPPNLGKDFGEDFKIKMSEIVKESIKNGTRNKTRNFGKKNGSSRGVLTPIGQFASVRETAHAFGVLPETIRRWILTKNDFNFLDGKNDKQPSKRKPSKSSAIAVVTPHGTFESMVQAAIFEGVRVQTLREWVKNPNRHEYKKVASTKK
jgi:transposase-like protein